MLTQREYLNTAKKLIGKWGHPAMLKSDDAIGYVAGYIMQADVTFDNNAGTKRSTWRLIRGKYGIRNYINRYLRQQNSIKSLDYCFDEEESTSLGDITPSNRMGIVDAAQVKELTALIMFDPQLRDVQKKCIILFFLAAMSYRQIGEIVGLSYTMVGNHVNHGIRLLRDKYGS